MKYILLEVPENHEISDDQVPYVVAIGRGYENFISSQGTFERSGSPGVSPSNCFGDDSEDDESDQFDKDK